MAIKAPTSYKATRAITINGVTYAKDATITLAAMKTLRKANMLVSSGRIKPTPDPHRRLKQSRRQPTTVHVFLQGTGVTPG
jgi:hypothetical protein